MYRSTQLQYYLQYIRHSLTRIRTRSMIVVDHHSPSVRSVRSRLSLYRIYRDCYSNAFVARSPRAQFDSRKKQRSDTSITTYLRVPRPRRCAAATAQHCDVFWWQNAETRDCLPCLMSQQSSAHDHTTGGICDRREVEKGVIGVKPMDPPRPTHRSGATEPRG